MAPVVPVAVANDVDTAREQVRPWLAFYLGVMGAAKKNFYVEAAERYGHGDSARAVQTAMLAGDRAGAAAALSDELIDSAAIATTPDELAGRIARYGDAGANTLVAIPCGDKAEVARALSRATRTEEPVGS